MKNMSKQFKSNLYTYGMIVLFYIIMQILVSTNVLSKHLGGLLVPVCVYTIMAVSLNLTVGILGELSLGHAGFMCIGAFVSSFFSMCMKDSSMASGLRFFIAIVLGALVTAVFGILIGIPVLRLRGDYLAIVTLAFGEIIKNIVNVLYVGKDSRGLHLSFKDVASMGLEPDGVVIIKGPQGITGTPKDATFTIGFIILLVTIFVVTNFINSRSGRAVMAIRDNRIAAESVGINISKYKLTAFAISASIAGAAGALYSHNYATLNAQPMTFGYNVSIMILVYVVLGGIGNIRGSVIAAALLTVLPELLRGFNDYRMLIYSIVLIVMMIVNSSPKFKDIKEKYSIKRYIATKKQPKKEEA